MNIDMHCHLLGNCKDINVALNHQDIYYDPDDNKNDFASFFVKNISIRAIKSYMKYYGAKIKENEITSEMYFDFIYDIFTNSKHTDQLVLLALDANYHQQTHELQIKETDLFISNKYLFNKVNELNKKLIDNGFINKKFLFGASVNPNRNDVMEELKYVVKETNAVLLKIIPSAQNIDLEDPRHFEFFRYLRDNDLPLLCHVGPELSLAEGINNKYFDQFYKLHVPLFYNVKVIAAHCAAPMWPWQFYKIKPFLNFLKYWNEVNVKLYTDISALTMSFRIPFLKKYIKQLNSEYLINGSDFPCPIEPWMHLPWITHNIKLKDYFDILKEKNPLDIDTKLKLYHGFNESVFSNYENILRLN